MSVDLVFRLTTDKTKNFCFESFFIILILFPLVSFAQENKEPIHPDSIIYAAREIMGMQKYCALVTIDSAGLPQVRTMNPFPPEKDMVVWIATNSRSRKVKEIRNNPNVCLYYANHSSPTGYVAITGKAVLIDDMDEKLKRKRDYWDQAFPDWKYLVLIKVVPDKIDVLNYKRGLLNDPLTWRTPMLELNP